MVEDLCSNSTCTRMKSSLLQAKYDFDDIIGKEEKFRNIKSWRNK